MRNKCRLLSGLLVGSVLLSVVAFASDVEKALKKKESGQGSSQGIGVSPSQAEFEGAPGERASFTLTVYNNAPNPIMIETMRNAGVVDKNGTVQVIPLAKALDQNTLARLLEVSPNPSEIPPRGERKVTIQLTVPKDYSGTHYASLSIVGGPKDATIVREKETEYVQHAYVGVRGGIGVPVVFTVTGSASYNLTILDGKLTRPSAHTSLSAELKVKNSGNAEIDAVLSGVVMDQSEKMVARLKASALKTVRPGTTVTLETEPSAKTLPRGHYKALLTITSTKIKPMTKELALVIP